MIQCSWIYNYIFVPIQSVPITTDVVSSILDQGYVYSIMWKFVSDMKQVSVFFSFHLVSSTNKTAPPLKYQWKWRQTPSNNKNQTIDQGEMYDIMW